MGRQHAGRVTTAHVLPPHRSRYLVRDRDAADGGDFVPRARRLGTQILLTPVRAPRANAVAERVVGTCRRECLDHPIVLNERDLRAVLREFVGYYNAARPHRILDLETLASAVRPILGGLHQLYERVG